MSNKYTEDDIDMLIDLLYKFSYVLLTVAEKERPGYLTECKKKGKLDEYLRHLSTIKPESDGSNSALKLIFEVPLEDVPLYLNSPLKFQRAIARWRCIINK